MSAATDGAGSVISAASSGVVGAGESGASAVASGADAATSAAGSTSHLISSRSLLILSGVAPSGAAAHGAVFSSGIAYGALIGAAGVVIGAGRVLA